ncbi:MAG: hypothetical protein LBW85_10155 [Deltaproteobacteria bacterium]|jgi:hypothetical protein|nr:hypothetical protein [Deltaproteobacteria bacterium]
MKHLIRTQLPLMILSLVMAGALWLFFTAQNVMPRDIIAVPAYTDPPPGLYVDLEELPASIVLTVEATQAQFQLIERSKNSKTTVTVDLSMARRGENIIPVVLEGNITPPLPRNIRNPKASPGEITFVAVPFRQRDVVVRAPDEAHVLATYLQPTGPWEMSPPMAQIEAPETLIDAIPELETRFVQPGKMITDVDNILGVLPLPPPGSESWFRVTPDRFTAHLPVEIRTATKSFYRHVAIRRVPPAEPGALGPEDPVALDPSDVRVTLSYRADRPDDRQPVPADVSLFAEVDPRDLRPDTPLSVEVKAETQIPGVAMAFDPPAVNALRLDEEAWRAISERRAARELQALTGSPASEAPDGGAGTVEVPSSDQVPSDSPAEGPHASSDITRARGAPAAAGAPAAGAAAAGTGGSGKAETGGKGAGGKNSAGTGPGNPGSPGNAGGRAAAGSGASGSPAGSGNTAGAAGDPLRVAEGEQGKIMDPSTAAGTPAGRADASGRPAGQRAETPRKGASQ